MGYLGGVHPSISRGLMLKSNKSKMVFVKDCSIYITLFLKLSCIDLVNPACALTFILLPLHGRSWPCVTCSSIQLLSFPQQTSPRRRQFDDKKGGKKVLPADGVLIAREMMIGMLRPSRITEKEAHFPLSRQS